MPRTTSSLGAMAYSEFQNKEFKEVDEQDFTQDKKVDFNSEKPVSIKENDGTITTLDTEKKVEEYAKEMVDETVEMINTSKTENPF